MFINFENQLNLYRVYELKFIFTLNMYHKFDCADRYVRSYEVET